MTSTSTGDIHLFAIAKEADRLHEIWLKSCKAYSAAEGLMFDKRQRGEPISDAERAKVSEAEALEDADRKAYEAIETRLLCTQAHTPQGLATKLRVFRMYDGHKNERRYVDGFIADAERIGCAGLTKDREQGGAISANWRQTLDEYTRLTIATNGDDGPALKVASAELTAIEYRIAEAPIDGLESIIAKLAINWNYDRNMVGGDPRSIALSAVLDFLAKETGFDPFIEYDRQDEMVPLSEEKIAEAAALANGTVREGDAS